MISGSPDEREIGVEEILSEELPPIVLCAAQYKEYVRQTFDYFFRKGYEVFVQWLNPGYSDSGTYQDQLNIADYLLKKGATLQIRNGAIDPIARVEEIRQFILGWIITVTSSIPSFLIRFRDCDCR